MTSTDTLTLAERLEQLAKPDKGAPSGLGHSESVPSAWLWWQPLATAPYREPVFVRVGSMAFRAHLLPDASKTSDEEPCDQWVAEIEGEHPPCWSGGACWASNEDELPSLQPEAWMPLDGIRDWFLREASVARAKLEKATTEESRRNYAAGLVVVERLAGLTAQGANDPTPTGES